MQDLTSWTRDGIAGLQSVVLYSLPELDGAIDTVPLGGLMGNNIFLVPERVKRLSARLRKWVDLAPHAHACELSLLTLPAYCSCPPPLFLYLPELCFYSRCCGMMYQEH